MSSALSALLGAGGGGGGGVVPQAPRTRPAASGKTKSVRFKVVLLCATARMRRRDVSPFFRERLKPVVSRRRAGSHNKSEQLGLAALAALRGLLRLGWRLGLGLRLRRRG